MSFTHFSLYGDENNNLHSLCSFNFDVRINEHPYQYKTSETHDPYPRRTIECARSLHYVVKCYHLHDAAVASAPRTHTRHYSSQQSQNTYTHNSYALPSVVRPTVHTSLSPHPNLTPSLPSFQHNLTHTSRAIPPSNLTRTSGGSHPHPNVTPPLPSSLT
jgi:hypothetical protein